ncbi:MAG: biotin synthase BioB [Actinobacteria bacterium]|nr:biotin synthase BioB [Actinomycetota bacterium]
MAGEERFTEKEAGHTSHILDSLEKKVLDGAGISREEAIQLSRLGDATLYRLFAAAGNIRDVRAGKCIDLCSIINAKSGGCSEDCKFCAQSSHYHAKVEIYGLLSIEEVLERAHQMESLGVKRFSIVISGRGIGKKDLERVLEIYRCLNRETNLKLCASLGIIDRQVADKLKAVGVSMYHHNLETAESYFPHICTTHSYVERVETIRAAQEAGLEVCSGGIISMGETMDQRLELAFTLRELGIKSVPVNILNPIKGTGLEGREILPPLEILKTIAIFRFILPGAMLRFAGGRENALRQLQALGYIAGINASLIGGYLTTPGADIGQELQMIRDVGLE